jgi:GMC oxidoreductase
VPIVFAEHVVAQGFWGETLREYMRDYVHWATFGALCEFLPRAENENLRSFAVPNLFIVDGSVCPTQGSANPALTIMALAARAADYLAEPASAA